MPFNPFNGILLAAMISSAVVSGGYLGSGVPLVRTSQYNMGHARVSFCRAANAPAVKRTPLLHQHRKRQLDDESHPGHQSNQQQNLEANSTSSSTDLSISTRSPPLTTIDLTPAKFNTTCYAGTFQSPELGDCAVVIGAQLYNSTGSLRALPGEYVFVSYGTCATVFQNPLESDYKLEYNWAELGAVSNKLARRCLLPEDHSMGGVAAFKSYLGRPLTDVVMSLQRFDDRDFIIDE